MVAALNDNIEMARLLLDKGANTETKNKVTPTFLNGFYIYPSWK